MTTAVDTKLHRFFPADRRSFVIDRDVEKIFDMAEIVLGMMNRFGIANRVAGRLTIVLKRSGISFVRDIGVRTVWSYPFDEIAADKLNLGQATGLDTRHVQSCVPTLLMGDDTVHFGSASDEGVEVFFSGIQAYGDARFCEVVLGLFNWLWDHRHAQLSVIRSLFGFDRWAQAMDKVEEEAERLDLSECNEAVASLVDAAKLAAARQLVAEADAPDSDA